MAQLNVALPLQNRRIIRGAVNPLDKSTIVSIYPRPMVAEKKHTLFPGEWSMPAGSYDKPAILVIGPSSWYMDKDEESPIVEVALNSLQIAESVVKDYVGSMLESELGVAQPGMFFIYGSLTLAEVKSKHQDLLDHYNQLQKNWFLKLVQQAESLWARSNGNPISISSDMRMAATELGLQAKPWLQDYAAAAMIKCVACGNLRNPDYPICPTCKYIDQSHPKAKDLKFAV